MLKKIILLAGAVLAALTLLCSCGPDNYVSEPVDAGKILTKQ